MRRARLQVKPNLGPKPGARPAESPAKPKPALPVTTARPAPSTTPTSHDGKADNNAQLKSADNKPGDYTVPQSAAHHVGDGGISDKLAHGAKAQSTAGSKSPRRASSTEHVKVSNSSAKSGNVKSDGSGVAAFPSPLSPGRIRSPRKSVGSDQTHAPPKSPGAVSASSSSDKGAEKASGKNAAGVVSSTDNVDSTKKVAASSSIVKPVVRGIRSRFTKVKPNLAEAGKRKAPPVAEKKTPEVRKATEDSTDGADLEAEKTTEKEKQAREELTATVEVTDTESSNAIASEKKTENDDVVSETNTTDQPVLEATPSHPNSVGLEDNADAASDVGLVSQVSTDVDTENGPGDASLTSDTFAVPDEPKKTAGEKKSRRSKPALPTPETLPDRSKMKMGDLIYWNPSRNPMKKKESKIPQPSASSQPGEGTETPSAVSTDDEASNDAMPVPQLKIGPDGNIILNIESLVMDNKAGDPTAAQMETIEEDDDRFITCNSFRNKQLLKRWTQHETERFFNALSQVGTDFSLMSKLFPSRTRRDLKNKFCKEEKRNRPRIDKALHERQPFDRETFAKAMEEEKAEKRRQEAVEEAKQKKKKRRKMKEETEEEEEESTEPQEEGEEEGRKENNKKRRIKKLHQEGGMFPPYKKTKRGRSAAGHNNEVVEILMSMSQGKVASGKEEMDDSASDAGSVDSFSSSTSSKSNSAVFVPKVARPTVIMKGQPSSPSSRNVIVESEVPVPESPMRVIGSSLRSMPLQGVNIVNINQSLVPKYEAANGTAGDGSTPSIGVDNNAGASGGAPAMTLPAGGQVVDIASFIEGLQTQTSQPVDVVLVEQQAEGGQQGLVHVYLVPRAAEGDDENSIQGERGGENSVQGERGGENSVQSERGGKKSVQSERGGENSVQSDRGGENSVQIERVGENSVQSEIGGENSIQIERVGENSVQIERGGENSVLSERGGENSVQSEIGSENSVQSDRGSENSVQSERGGENSVQSEMGVKNSVQSEMGGENSVQSEMGGENSVQSESSGENSVQSETGGENSAESGEKQSVNAQTLGDESSSVLSETQRTSLLSPHNTGNDISLSDPQSDRNNQQLVVDNAHTVQVMDVEGVNSLNQGGEKNSLQHVGSNVSSAEMTRNESMTSENQGPGVSTVLSQAIVGSNTQITGVEPNTTQDLGSDDEIVIDIDEDTWNSIQTEEDEMDISNSVSHASSSGHVREVVDLTVDEVTSK